MDSQERDYVLWCLCRKTYKPFICGWPNVCICPTKEYVNFLIEVLEKVVENNHSGNRQAIINWRCVKSTCRKKDFIQKDRCKVCVKKCCECCRREKNM